MAFEQWSENLAAQLRRYGLSVRFSEYERRALYRDGHTPDSAYGVACDVYCGFDFHTANAANLNG